MLYIAVCGPGTPDADARTLDDAERIGRGLAEAGAIVVTGGLGGAMEAASRGARSAGGITLGLLPGTDRADANAFVTVAVPTGLGELRNGLVVRTADAVVTLRGGWGTLSELALARKLSTPVVALGDWPAELDGLERVADAGAAVARALALARAAGRA